MLRTDYEIREALERLPTEDEFKALEYVHDGLPLLQRDFLAGLNSLDDEIRSLHDVRLPGARNSLRSKERVYAGVLARLNSILEMCERLQPMGERLGAADIILSRHGHGSRRLPECYGLVNTGRWRALGTRLHSLEACPLPADVMRHVFLGVEYDGTQLTHPDVLSSAFETRELGREQFGVLVRNNGSRLQVIEHPLFRKAELVEKRYTRRSFVLPGEFGDERQKVLCSMLPDELVTYFYGRSFSDFPACARFAELELPPGDGNFYVMRRAPAKGRGHFNIDIGFLNEDWCDGNFVQIREFDVRWGGKQEFPRVTYCSEEMLYEQAQILMGGPLPNPLEILECDEIPVPYNVWSDVGMLFDPGAAYATLVRGMDDIYFNGMHYDCKDSPIETGSLEALCLGKECGCFDMRQLNSRVWVLEPEEEVLDFLSFGRGKRLARHGSLNRVKVLFDVKGPAILPLSVSSELEFVRGRENVEFPVLGRDMFINPILSGKDKAGCVRIKKKKGLLGRLF